MADNPDTPWRCIFPEYTLNYMETPVFILNDLYDYVALDFTYRNREGPRIQPINIMQCVDGVPGACPKEEQDAYLFYGEKMRRDVKAYLDRAGTKSGSFLIEQAAHCELCSSRFYSVAIDGVTMRDAVETWFFA